MKVLVIGSGGREHALCWKLKQNPKIEKIFAAPGNAGTAELAENVAIKADELHKLLVFAKKEAIDYTFVGPEVPLVKGIVDLFKKEDLNVFGPTQDAAQLEGSKVFSKDLMKKYDIPTAKYESFAKAEAAISYIKKQTPPLVVKAEGLAAGKGVIIAQNIDEAIAAVEEIMLDKKFGQAGNKIVVEEFLEGEEATILSFTDGETIVPLLPSQDHKPAYDGGEGPNTGGMGAYAPAPVVDEELSEDIYENILIPTLEALKAEGIDYQGVLYTGLMIDQEGQAKVLEYNARFGDPEAQVILPLLENDLIEIAEAVNNKELVDIDLSWRDKKAVCVVLASGGYPVDYETGKEITGIKDAEKLEDTVVFQAGTKRENDKLVTAGGRVLNVIALGDEYEATIKQAYQGLERIDFAKAHYRSDIGHKAINRDDN